MSCLIIVGLGPLSNIYQCILSSKAWKRQISIRGRGKLTMTGHHYVEASKNSIYHIHDIRLYHSNLLSSIFLHSEGQSFLIYPYPWLKTCPFSCLIDPSKLTKYNFSWLLNFGTTEISMCIVLQNLITGKFHLGAGVN